MTVARAGSISLTSLARARAIRYCAFIVCALSTAKVPPFPRVGKCLAESPPKCEFLFSFTGPNEGFNKPLSIFFDRARNELLVANTSSHAIEIFSVDGVSRFSIGRRSRLRYPMGVGVLQGRVFVSEMQSGILKILDERGKVRDEINLETACNVAPARPGRFCFTGGGDVCVADRTNSRVIVFDRNRRLKLSFGGPGNARGEFMCVEDIATDSSGRMYVSDSQGTAVQVFDSTGAYLFGFGKHTTRPEDFSHPVGIELDKTGRIWVVDSFQHRLKVFSADGDFMAQFGDYGTGNGQLFFPVDICFDATGRAYVLEKGSRRVQVLKPSWN